MADSLERRDARLSLAATCAFVPCAIASFLQSVQGQEFQMHKVQLECGQPCRKAALRYFPCHGGQISRDKDDTST